MFPDGAGNGDGLQRPQPGEAADRLSLKRAQWQQEEEVRETVLSSRPEKKNLRGGLEGGEITTGLGDVKLGQ